MLDNNLKECREDLGLTQTELGNVLGVHYSTISGWEIGRDNKKYKDIIKLDKYKVGKNIKEIRKKLKLTQKKWQTLVE